MGILGTGSLAAYNAGNTYQDALARARTAQGQHAVSLDLGAFADRGYLVQQSHQLLKTQLPERYIPMCAEDLCALLDVVVGESSNSGTALVSKSKSGAAIGDSQIIVGIRPPAYWKSPGDVAATMDMPFWGHMHHLAPPPSGEDAEAIGDGAMMKGMDGRRGNADATQRLAEAAEMPDAVSVVTEALAQHASVLLGTPFECLDTQSPMHSYGLDSLSAMELRNWVLKLFGVDLPVFEILGGATFDAVASDIVRKVREKQW